MTMSISDTLDWLPLWQGASCWNLHHALIIALTIKETNVPLLPLSVVLCM